MVSMLLLFVATLPSFTHASSEDTCSNASVPLADLIKTDRPPPASANDPRMLKIGLGGKACDSLANLDTYDYWLFYHDDERELNRPEKVRGPEQRMRIRRADGHESLRGVRCSPVAGGRGINVMWKCVDMHSGQEVAGAVKWEGCFDRHDPLFFTVGSAYFKPHPINKDAAFFDTQVARALSIVMFGLLGWLIITCPIGDILSAIIKMSFHIMFFSILFGIEGGSGGSGGRGSTHNSFSGYASDEE